MAVLRRCGGAPDWKCRVRRLLPGLMLIMPMMVHVRAALADSYRSFAELQHTAWSLSQGAPPRITAIAQTPDGYLWLGSATGLYRFDGVSFEAISDSPSDRPHSDYIYSLLVTRSGELWVGYRFGGAAVLRNGIPQPVALDRSAAGVGQMVQDRSGAIWIRRRQTQHELLRYAEGSWEVIGAEWGLAGEAVGELFLASDGVLWLTNRTSVQFLRPGTHRFQSTGEHIDGQSAALFEDSGGTIWIVDRQGARRLPDYLHGAHAAAPPSTPQDDGLRPYNALIASDGAFWGTDGSHGVFRFDPGNASSSQVTRGQMETFDITNGLTSESASSIFQDREHNIWVGTNAGLDQFRPKLLVTENRFSAPAGSFFSTAADDEGTVYVSSLSGTFRIPPYREPEPILPDVKNPVDICKGYKRGIWAVTESEVARWQDGDASHFAPPGVDMIDFRGCAEDINGTFWNASGPYGLQSMNNGRWTRVGVAELASDGGMFENVEPDAQGGVSFILTNRGIFGLDNGHFKILTTFKDMGIGLVHGLSQQGRDLLVSGQYGLARIRDGMVKSLRSDRNAWLKATVGVVETKQGGTWIVTSAGLFSLPTTEFNAALDAPERALKPTRYDSADGLPAWTGQSGSEHAAVEGGDGRIWVDTGEHIVYIDPAHLPHNPLPPPVEITSIVADGRRYRAGDEVTLPQGAANLQLFYTALSLTIPERVQFKYRLLGYDRDWVEAGGRREAFYTNLPPARYSFQVIAANNDGIWNQHGASISFEVPPTFLQSRLFLMLCTVAFVLISWVIYATRVHQISQRMRAQLEVRLAERERIARELHDTILQGFHGLLLRFQAVANRIPCGEQERHLIERELDQAEAVLVEGRRRIQELRTNSDSVELANLLTQEAEAARIGTTLSTSVAVRGEPRTLHPLVQEELARIGQEAIRNVVLHANATELEVCIDYRQRGLSVSFGDNGIGIEPAILARGSSERRFGLPGIRERTRRIQGKFEISSSPGSGTRIQIEVPARAAYAVTPTRHLLRLSRWQPWKTL